MRRKAQIASVLARGRAAGRGGLQMYAVPNEIGPRLGVIAGRHAWPRAVDRNRFRRLVRETFRRLQHRLQPRDYLVRARKPQGVKPCRAEIETLFTAWCEAEGE